MPIYAEWNPATFYITGDIVQYLAAIYEALSNNNNIVPLGNPLIWDQIGGSGGVNAIAAGPGISVNPVPPVNPTVSINLASSDARLTITNGIGTQRILNNQCPISVSAGPSLTASGVNLTGITIDMPNVGVAGTSAFPTSITTDAKGRVSAITAGSAPVASVSAGTGITIGGVPNAPVVNNAGLLGLTAANQGTAITITGTPTNPIISAVLPPGTADRASRLIMIGNNTISQGLGPGQTGWQAVGLGVNLSIDFSNGGSPDPNGQWVIDLGQYPLTLTGLVNTGFVQVGLGSSNNPAVFYPIGSTVGGFPITGAPSGKTWRDGTGASLIFRVSDALAVNPAIDANSARLVFSNATTNDTLYFGLQPTLIPCYYFPNGCQ